MTKTKIKIFKLVTSTATISMLALSPFIVMTPIVQAEPTWPDCIYSNSCTANDVNINNIWLGDCTTGDPLISCTSGVSVSTCIWVELNNGTGSNRYSVTLLAEKYINDNIDDNVDTCALDSLPTGISSYNLENINWVCGDDIELKNIVIAWGTSGKVCSESYPNCNKYPGGQCYKPTNIHVAAPLVADFSHEGQCSGDEVQFTADVTGGTPPYTYQWFLGDGSAMSSEENPTYTYNTPATYPVEFWVYDNASNSDSQSYDVVIEYCPYCGNSILDDGEDCDDGNTENGDGCSSDCTIELECEVDADCDDQLYCSGEETCIDNECVLGTTIVCSDYDILGIEICENDPDSNPFTWDFRDPFVSVCNEETDACTTGNETITHTCNVGDCGAECDAQNPCEDTNCEDGCVGNDWYDYSNVANTCQEDCSCTTNQCGEPNITPNSSACTECQTDDDCNDLDDENYCEGTVIKYDEGVCNDGYQCEVETIEVMDCDNGLTCDGAESCSLGNCVDGTMVDCSENDILGIETCENDPDSNPFTWDFRDPFTSVCEEPIGACSSGDETIIHDCDAQCGGCTSNTDCDDQDPNTTDTCNSNTCGCEHILNPYCGDQICSGEETCDNCEVDCGSCEQVCPDIIIVSDTDTKYYNDSSWNPSVLSWVHPSWNSGLSIKLNNDGADWIWESERVVDPINGDIVDFQRNFDIVGIPGTSTLYITADNGYEVSINGSVVGDAQVSGDWETSDLTQSFVDTTNWQSVETLDVTSNLHTGANVLNVTVANEYMGPLDGQANGTIDSNPAGLIYKLVIERSSCTGLVVIKHVINDNDGTSTASD
ncbi:PKD domain-containing protein, partial [Patescibacteria group bacterium]